MIATTALISKQYNRALELLSDIKSTLKFSNYNSIWFNRLSTYTYLLKHLFTQLLLPNSTLDFRSLSTINYVMTLYSRIAQTPQLYDLLPEVLELLGTKLDASSADKALRAILEKFEPTTFEKNI